MEKWIMVHGTPLSRDTAPAYVERLARWAYGRGESDIYALQVMGEIEARIIQPVGELAYVSSECHYSSLIPMARSMRSSGTPDAAPSGLASVAPDWARLPNR